MVKGRKGDRFADSQQCIDFDIQETALRNTRERTAAFVSRIEYVLRSHAEIATLVTESIDVAMFNLGYLPGEEHVVTTQWESTRAGLEQVLEKLSLNGVCIIVAYPGHEAGAREAEMLEEFLQHLPRKIYMAGCYRLLNHARTAPYAYVVEKVK